MAEKKINGQTYKVEKMLATDAVKLKLRLLKTIGAGVDQVPAILAGAGSKATPEQKEKSNSAAIHAFTEIFVKADPDEMTDLIKDILEVAMIKREGSGTYDQVDMDDDFTDDLAAMIPVAVFVLRETFGDFFTGLLAPGNLAKLAKG
jgi:hypothetical protein